MLTHQPLTSLQSSNKLFETICTLAIEQREDDLKALLASGVVIGVYHKNRFNPVQWLAMNGELDALWFLINKFNGSLNDAVYGAAANANNDVKLMNQLMARGASWAHAIAGSARGENYALMEKLAKFKGIDLNATYVRMTRVEAFSNSTRYTVKSDKELGLELVAFELAAKPDKLSIIKVIIGSNPKYAIMGAGFSGNIKILQSLFPYSEPSMLDHDEAIYGAALAGNTKLVSHLLSERKSSVEAPKMAARGYAMRNEINCVNRLIDKYGDHVIDSAVYGAAHGGHVYLMHQLIQQGASLNDALLGAAEGEHLELVNQLIQAGADVECAINFYQKKDLHPLYAVHLMSVIEDPYLKSAIAKHAALKENEKIDTLIYKRNANQNSIKRSRGLVLQVVFTPEDSARTNLMYMHENELLWKAFKQTVLLKDYQLDREQMDLWVESSLLHFMFLQGIQLINKHKMNIDVFMTICSFVFGKSPMEMRNMFDKHNDVMPAKLYHLVVRNAENNYQQPESSKIVNTLTKKPIGRVAKKVEKTLSIILPNKLKESALHSKPLKTLTMFASSGSPIYTKDDLNRVKYKALARFYQRKMT